MTNNPGWINRLNLNKFHVGLFSSFVESELKSETRTEGEIAYSVGIEKVCGIKY